MAKKPAAKKIPGLAIALSLCVAAIIPYWQTRHFDFVNYDDDDYVYENPNVQAGFTPKSIAWSFSMSGYASNWHPLTWLSHILDIQLFGLKPGPHHLTNVFFHCINAVLLFLLLRLMTGAVWKSAFVAALFALHPMHVESVAWVSERKDVLSAFFWIATTLAYVWYAGRRGVPRYLLVIFLFCLGLMAKPMLVTLPCTLLLLDFWPLGRMKKRERASSIRFLLLEKTPLFFLAAVSSVITFIVQQKGGAVASLEAVPFGIRIANTIVSYGAYLWKMIVPANMACLYPQSSLVAWEQVGVSLACMGIVTAISLKTVRRMPFLLVGWLWYLGTLAPVIGMVQVGSQAMADRYTYIPYIGAFIMVAWGIPELLRGLAYKKTVLWLVAATVVVAMIAKTSDQVRYWKDSVTLSEHAIAITKNNSIAHYHLGNVLGLQGRIDAAIAQYVEALRINQNNDHAHNNLGIILAKQGRMDEAVVHFRQALRINPTDAGMHDNIGLALAQLGKTDEALGHFSEALRLNPGDFKTESNLGITLAQLGKTDEAIRHFKEALRLNPDFPAARQNLEWVMRKAGTAPRP